MNIEISVMTPKIKLLPLNASTRFPLVLDLANISMKKLIHWSLSITEPLNGIIMVVKKSFQTQQTALELKKNIEISVMIPKIKPLALNASIRFLWVLDLVNISMKKLTHQYLSIIEPLNGITMAGKKLSQTQQTALELMKNIEISASTQGIKPSVLNANTRFQWVLDLANISMKKLTHWSLNTTEPLNGITMVVNKSFQTQQMALELMKNIEILDMNLKIKPLALNASTIL